MVKDKVMMVRMRAEDKEKFEKAARRQGQSVTDFIINVGLKEADKILKEKEGTMEKTIRRPTQDGVPTFLRALCSTASSGGTNSYKDVGYNFGGATEGEQPWDVDNSQWLAMLEDVKGYIRKGDRVNIWLWYKKTYPKVTALIPSRRKDSFVDGILQAYDENSLWFI